MSGAPRRSLGGAVVEQSLESVGFDVRRPDVAMVETRRPGSSPFSAVLAQSAFHVLPRHEFVALVKTYPAGMRWRMYARRAVARTNLRRAGHVVCLTEAMAQLVRDAIPRASDRVVCVEALLPTDSLEHRHDVTTPGASLEDTLLVPGTVTWYKRPELGLECAQALGLEKVLYAGPDDGSGCWQTVQERAAALGIRVDRQVLDRAAMLRAYDGASTVLLPSALESLGFGLSEALVRAAHVVASPIPAHKELAAAIGREPAWLPAVEGGSPNNAQRVTARAIRDSWQAVGAALGLDRQVTRQAASSGVRDDRLDDACSRPHEERRGVDAPRLHIVLMSNLAKDQGGRETWLQYFSQAVVDDYREIHVYGADVDRERTALPARAIVHSSTGSSVPRFALWTARSLLRNSSKDDVFIYCGVPVESAIGYVTSFLRRNATHIVWARGRGVAEIRGAIAERQPTWKERALLAIMEVSERLALRRLHGLYNGVDTIDHFRARYKINPASSVIPNAVPGMNATTQTPLDTTPRTRVRVGYVGRLIGTKGYPDFLELAATLPASTYSCEAWGPNIGGYDDSPAVVHHGAVARKDIAEVLRSLDVVVFLNRNAGGQAAGVSHGILEAMHCGCVIVAWDNPTHAQLLDSSNSLLAAEGDLAGLRARVIEAATLSEDARSSLRRTAMKSAEPFSVDAHVSTYREFVANLSGRTT